MGKQLTLKETWKLFLETALNVKNIEITNVTKDSIEIKTNSKTIQDIRKKIGNSELLKENVVHAVHTLDKKDEKTTEDKNKEKVESILAKNGQETLLSLFEQGVVKEIFQNQLAEGQTLEIKDSRADKIMHFEVQALNAKRATQINQSLETMAFMLSDEDKLVKIFTGKDPKFSQEPEDDECEASEWASSIFKSTKQGKTVKIEVNYGLIHQALQKHLHAGAPIVVHKEKDEKDEDLGTYVLDKEYCLEYLGGIYTKGLVFMNENGDYRPIVFSKPAEKVASDNNNNKQGKQEAPDTTDLKKFAPLDNKFVIALDTSNSLKGNFADYIKSASSVVKKITESMEQWEIELITFNQDVSPATIFKSGGNNFTEIEKHLTGLAASGKTNLYGAMSESLKHIKGFLSGHANANSVFILFTDGQHQLGKDLTDFEKLLQQKEELNVVNDVKALREISSQFQMFTIGSGNSYNQKFFQKITSSGTTHIHVDSPDKINELDPYVDGMTKQQILLKFVVDSAVQYLQAPKGEVVIAPFTVKPGKLEQVQNIGATLLSSEIYEINFNKGSEDLKTELSIKNDPLTASERGKEEQAEVATYNFKDGILSKISSSMNLAVKTMDNKNKSAPSKVSTKIDSEKTEPNTLSDEGKTIELNDLGAHHEEVSTSVQPSGEASVFECVIL